MEFLVSAAATASSTIPSDVIEGLAYIGAALGFAITSWLGWRSKTAKEKVNSESVATQVAAALADKENKDALKQLTQVIRDQNLLMQSSNGSRIALTEAMDRLSRRLDDR